MKKEYYRPDIDGLRAISVIGVLLFHFYPSILPGGYAGVDVFFTISGFLITGILIRSMKNETFSIARFYLNRIIRIFPVLLVVLTLSLVWGWFFYFPEKFARLGSHVAGGTLFISNLVFWKEVGYFDHEAHSKPLLHLWSLAVEEQFYIFWPVFVYFIVRKFKKPESLILLITLVSFFFSIFYIKSNPTGAFYNPVSRLWELSAGGLLSCLTYIDRAKIKYHSVFSFIGIALIILPFFLYTSTTTFPGKNALYPVIGTLLIIFMADHAWINRTILQNKYIVAIGLVSYPLYLWHWPLLVIAKDLTIFPSLNPDLVKVAMLLLSIFLAFLSYHFLEKPIQRHRTFKRGIILVCFSLILLVCGFGVYKDKGYAFRNIPRGTSYDWPTELNKNDLCTKMFLTDEKIKDADYCYIENTSSNKNIKTIIIGDSHANQLLPGFRTHSLAKDGYVSLGAGACSFASGWSRWEITGPSRGPDFCPQVVANSYSVIKRSLPKFIILSSRLALDTNLNDYQVYRAQWRSKNFPNEEKLSALKKELLFGLKELISTNATLIFLYQIPELTFDPLKCSSFSPPFGLTMNQMSNPVTNLNCVMPRELVNQRQKEYRTIMREIIKELNYKKLFTYDPLDLLCDEKQCNVVYKNELLYRDNNHLSVYGSNLLWEDLEGKLNHFLASKAEE